MQKYLYIQDNDCHWYIIPEDKVSAWYTFLEDIEEDCCIPGPEWAERCDAPDAFYKTEDVLKLEIELANIWSICTETSPEDWPGVNSAYKAVTILDQMYADIGGCGSIDPSDTTEE